MIRADDVKSTESYKVKGNVLKKILKFCELAQNRNKEVRQIKNVLDEHKSDLRATKIGIMQILAGTGDATLINKLQDLQKGVDEQIKKIEVIL